jgi:hypothetical protein
MSDNPFLLPPAGRPPAPPKTPDAAPAAAADPPGDPIPDHYIAVPASVESATHRIARPGATDEVRADGPTDAVAEETRVAPTARAWVLVWPDGTRLALTVPLLLGRNPAAIADRPDAELLAIADPGKSVSKTHALLEPAAEGVRLRDLHSTNGVVVDGPGGRELGAAGGELLAPAGATILLGSFAIGVVAG